MPTATESPVILCQDSLIRLEHDLTLPGGRVIPGGSLVLLLPQTMAECVLTPEGSSLASVWESLSRTGHTHPEVVGFSEELVRLADRVAALEMGITRQKTD